VLPGRAYELARIDGLLDGARNGVSTALIVCGDAGIGKTTAESASAPAPDL
jgi:hypothetical protein